VILLAFIAVGQIVLEALGIDLASFRIAGGLVLVVMALRMVLEETNSRTADSPAFSGNIAVFPLAMPFIAGPASIIAVVLLTRHNVSALRFCRSAGSGSTRALPPRPTAIPAWRWW
jgi:multiple antibiotic resistance protein